MPKKETLTDIPADKIDEVIQNYKDSGATEVTKTKQPDGRYTITATFDRK